MAIYMPRLIPKSWISNYAALQSCLLISHTHCNFIACEIQMETYIQKPLENKKKREKLSILTVSQQLSDVWTNLALADA